MLRSLGHFAKPKQAEEPAPKKKRHRKSKLKNTDESNPEKSSVETAEVHENKKEENLKNSNLTHLESKKRKGDKSNVVAHSSEPTPLFSVNKTKNGISGSSFHKSDVGKKEQFSSGTSKNNKRKTFGDFHKKSSSVGTLGLSDERLKAYGINPKKYHAKLKYSKKQNTGV
ncbi:protein KRI1 homolog [Limulus polyphemus]|uniref:Protein KRI1 homolog n=1 Tax=Limulus polyphemus TaxID=6850 RepID=A0ABM1SS10_LIMPO|nr:protein KRI1 homolog [Limulus polyphemus]